MTLMKRLERELILEWQRLQLETIASVKATGLRAYYLKLAEYRKSRAWSLELVGA
jgi:hypothetical protein